MRRIVLALMSTVTLVVLMFGYRTSTAHPAATTTVATGPVVTGDTSGSSSTTPAAPVPTSSSGSAAGTSTADTSAAGTFTGDAAQTRWGPVQVRITVADGKITAVDLVQVPSENPRDVEINDQAVPVLKDETIQAQSSQIDAVSGATVTSDGYTSSLQSALDQAGL